ncbi:MAG: energy transducer TonB [Bacteroidetes bacterium]|nr:energy transducer TonB [Bacteroidota bacterium]
MSMHPHDLDDYVFRRKNRSYGSYDLRKRESRTLLVALLLSSVSLGVLLSLPVIASAFHDPAPKSPEDDLGTEYHIPADLPEDPAPDPAPPLPTPPPPPSRAEISFRPPELTDDTQAPPTATIADNRELLNSDALVGNQDTDPGDHPGDGLPTRLPGHPETGGNAVTEPFVDPVPPDDKFIPVERQPIAVNLDDIKQRIQYPEGPKAMGIEGKVILRILVGKEGDPQKHLVLRSPHPALTEAAVKEIYRLRFTPAIQGGKPILFWTTVSIDFQLRK